MSLTISSSDWEQHQIHLLSTFHAEAESCTRLPSSFPKWLWAVSPSSFSGVDLASLSPANLLMSQNYFHRHCQWPPHIPHLLLFLFLPIQLLLCLQLTCLLLGIALFLETLPGSVPFPYGTYARRRDSDMPAFISSRPQGLWSLLESQTWRCVGVEPSTRGMVLFLAPSSAYYLPSFLSAF